MSSRVLPDWLSGWMEFTDNTEPPYLYRLWTGLSVIAAGLRRKCFLPWGMYDVYPNMYIVLVGPSGLGKGMAMGPAIEILRDMQIKLAAEATTREALIRDLSECTDTTIADGGKKLAMHCSLTVFSEELTVFLGYSNLQLMADLCNWYDCRREWTYQTKHQGVDSIHGVWVNLLGGTTPELLQSSLPQDAIGGGLTARMILVYETKRGKIVPIPTLSERARKVRQDLLQDGYRIANMFGTFRVTDELVLAYTDWYNNQDKDKPQFSDPRFGGYLRRRPLHAIKVAMLLSASQSDDMVITAEHFDKARRIITETEANMGNTFRGMTAENTRAQLVSTLKQVAAALMQHQELSYAQLLQLFYQDIDKWGMDKILETLMGMGAVHRVIQGTKEIYRINPNAPIFKI